jgi:hypothetical protein
MTSKNHLFLLHLIQDAQQTDCCLQLIHLDIKKAFDRISHVIIIQAFPAFGVLEVLIQVLCHL